VAEVIFVEGPPGTGKSTTAQFLARQLAHHGRAARWIYEEEIPNPFVPPSPPPGVAAWQDATWEEFADAHVGRWRDFARAAADTAGTIVAESFLLQRPVFTMLRRDADHSAIEALVNRFADAVAALAPTLIYLSHHDPEASWRAVMAKRGGNELAAAIQRSEDWPFTQSRGLAGLDGLLAYWRAHAALCGGIVSWLPMTTHVVDVASGTWPERRRRICELLAIPSDEAAPPARDTLAPLAGRYRSGDDEITITLEEGGLVLRGVLWASNVLLPVPPGLFDVESWPLRVRFEDNAAGAPRVLRWEGARLWWGGPGGAYERVHDQ
jgi:DNA polymerase III delta prime subunit